MLARDLDISQLPIESNATLIIDMLHDPLDY